MPYKSSPHGEESNSLPASKESQKRTAPGSRREFAARTEAARLGLSQMGISPSGNVDQAQTRVPGRRTGEEPSEFANMSPFPHVPMMVSYTTKHERSQMRGEAASKANAYLPKDTANRQRQIHEEQTQGAHGTSFFAKSAIPDDKSALRQEIKEAKNSIDMAMAELQCLRRGQSLASRYPGVGTEAIAHHLNAMIAREKGILDASEARYRQHPEVLAGATDSVSTDSGDVEGADIRSTAESGTVAKSRSAYSKGRNDGLISGGDRRIIGYQSN